MAKFYDDDEELVLPKKKPRQPRLPKEQGLGGQIDNQYPLNDYRNRMPFKSVDKDGKEFYYWQYGSLFELEFEIEDSSLPLIPQHVVDVLVKDNSFVNKETKIANIALGTMSRAEKDDYIYSSEVEKLLAKVLVIINDARRLSTEANKYMDAIEEALARRKTMDETAIESLQSQIADLRNSISRINSFEKELVDIRKELEEVRSSSHKEVESLRGEYQKRLREITTSYYSKLEEMEQRLTKSAEATNELNSVAFDSISSMLAEMRRAGIGAEERESLPATDELDSPLIVKVADKLYVKLSGQYKEVISAASEETVVEGE